MTLKKTTPSVSSYSAAFRYRNAASTDIRKTFERVRKQMKVAQQQADEALVQAQAQLDLGVVVALPQRARGVQ